MIVGYVWQILGRGAFLPHPHPHPWAAQKRPILNRVKWQDKIVNEDISKLCKEYRKILIVLIEKLLQRMAVSLPFLIILQCVIPINISDKEKKVDVQSSVNVLFIIYLVIQSLLLLLVIKPFKNTVCWFQPERKLESAVSLIERANTWIISISRSLI